VRYTPSEDSWFDAEFDGVAALVSSLVPAKLSESLGARQVRAFSRAIGHDPSYELHWNDR